MNKDEIYEEKLFHFTKGTLYDLTNVCGCTIETKPIYVYIRCTDSAVKLIFSHSFNLTEILKNNEKLDNYQIEKVSISIYSEVNKSMKFMI